MDSKLLKDFLAEQPKLLQSTARAKPAHKDIIRPEKPLAVEADMNDPEVLYNYILEKKPAPKKLVKFLQTCIDSIMEDED